MLFTVSASPVEFRSMLTLTYGLEYPVDGERAKEHMHKILNALKYRYGLHYFWFLEFQARGAPHFHILTNRRPFDEDRRWVAERWMEIQGIERTREYCVIANTARRNLWKQGVSVHAHARTWEDIRTPRGAIKYVAKYACKPTQKAVPARYQNVGRFWGCDKRTKEYSMSGYVDIDANNIRLVLKEINHPAADWDILPKYIFSEELTEAIARHMTYDVSRETI